MFSLTSHLVSDNFCQWQAPVWRSWEWEDVLITVPLGTRDMFFWSRAFSRSQGPR